MSKLKLSPPRQAFTVSLGSIVQMIEQEAAEQHPLEGEGVHYHAYPDFDEQGRFQGVTVMECVADQDEGEGDELPEDLLREFMEATKDLPGDIISARATNIATGQRVDLTEMIRKHRGQGKGRQDAGPALKEGTTAEDIKH